MSVSNDQLYEEIVKISRDIGMLSAGVNTFKETLATHIEDDKRMNTSISHIELRMAKQAGSVRVWGIVATAVAGIASAAASYLTKAHGL